MDRAKNKHQVLSLITTVGSQADAQRLAQGLLAARLAACVQVEPGLVSHYRWQGKGQQEGELRLTIKSTVRALPPLLAHLREHHPYELPQLVWQVLEASPEYAAWVEGELSAPAGAGQPGPA